MAIRQACLAVVLVMIAGSVSAKPLRIPFDFSRSEIGIEITVKGTPLFVLLDTGVDPSTIDFARANTLRLKIDLSAGGEGSGVGGAAHAISYPTTIEGLAIAGRAMARVEALTADMGAVSTGYGKRIDGALGYSFLKDKSVLIDYPAHELYFLEQSSDANAVVKACRTRWSVPLNLLKDENWPQITQFRLGAATLTATLDTGSNGTITLYRGAPDLPGVRAAMVREGDASSAGFRGKTKRERYTLAVPVGFGPFNLAAGQIVTLGSEEGPGKPVLANIGNELFAAMKLKMLLDYRGNSVTFYGDCP